MELVVACKGARPRSGISLLSLERLQKVACHNKKLCLYCHLAICGGSVLGFEVALFFLFFLRSVEQRV